MTELTPEEKSAELRRHVALMGKITTMSGWVLAVAALFMSSYLLNKMHLEIVEMQRENKELRMHVEKSMKASQLERDKKFEAASRKIKK